MSRTRRVLVTLAALLALPLVGTLSPGERSQLHVAAGEAPLCREAVAGLMSDDARLVR
jgi:hypothetical protein